MTELAPGSIDALARALHDHEHHRWHRSPILAASTGNLAVGVLNLNSGRCLLLGWSVAQVGGAAFAAQLIDGDDTTGMSIAGLAVAVGAASHYAYPGEGLLLQGGLTVNVTAGSAAGAVYYRVLR